MKTFLNLCALILISVCANAQAIQRAILANNVDSSSNTFYIYTNSIPQSLSQGYLYVDAEALLVQSAVLSPSVVTGNSIVILTVGRAAINTSSAAHAAGAPAFFGYRSQFVQTDMTGPCSPAGPQYLNVVSQLIFSCGPRSTWFGVTTVIVGGGTGTGITALVGDVTTIGSGTVPATLADVNGTPGTFGGTSNCTTSTVSTKGLTTNISSTPCDYLAPATGAVTRTVASWLNDIFNAKNFGIVSDGTDQSARFQTAITAINANGGGSLFIPYSPSCYVVSAAVKVGSNTTVFSDARATCVKKAPGTQPACTDPGCNSVFYTDTTAAHSNIYFENFTIDGNKANITGVSGDGGNFGIMLAGASNSGLQDMIVKNAYTGGVAVQCWGTSLSTLTNEGDSVSILNTIITASRRNNLENVCGTNTHMIGGELSYATGGSLSTGVDIEPNYTGTATTGFTMTGVHVHHNRDGGILLQSNFEVAPTYSFTNNNVHDNGAMYGGARLINFNSVAADRGTVSVIGGLYANNGAGAAAISASSWNTVKIGGGVTTLGSQRGVLIGNNVTEATLGPSNLSGTVYDLSVDGPASHATMVGAYLAHGIIQPADIPNVSFPLLQSGDTGIITGSGVLGSPYTFQSNSTTAPITKFQNTNSAGGVALDGAMFANDLGNGWALKSLGSTYPRAACLEAYNGTYIGMSLCPDGTLDIGRNNVGAGSTHTVDIKDGTATTGITQVFIRDGAGQSTTPALTVAGKSSFGSITVGGSAGITATVTCTAGQHINAITIVGGIITATPTCN